MRHSRSVASARCERLIPIFAMGQPCVFGRGLKVFVYLWRAGQRGIRDLAKDEVMPAMADWLSTPS
jgi:hypothetical protein